MPLSCCKLLYVGQATHNYKNTDQYKKNVLKIFFKCVCSVNDHSVLKVSINNVETKI